MDDRKKEGLSVRELGELGNKYRFEVFICLLLLLATIFNFIFVGGYLSIIAISAGAIIGALTSGKIESFLRSLIRYPSTQQTATQIVIAAAVLVIGIFLPFIVFFFIGLYGGHALYKLAMLR